MISIVLLVGFVCCLGNKFNAGSMVMLMAPV